MKVLIVKDGTVPIVVAKIIATDWGPEGAEDGELALDRYGIESDVLETFEVDGEPEALDVTWADGEGFSVYGTTLAEWFKYRQEDECGGKIEPVLAPLHFVQSDICHGEDEHWYSHLFVLPR